MSLQLTQQEVEDKLKAQTTAFAATIATFNTTLATAKAASAAAKVAADADGGADAGTVTAVDDADTAVQALDLSAICGFCKF